MCQRRGGGRRPIHRRHSHGNRQGAMGGLRGGGQGEGASIASLLGRIYMEQLFGQDGSDEEDEEEEEGGLAAVGAGGRGRGVGGGALAALSAMLGGGVLRLGARRSDGLVEVLMADDAEEDAEDDEEEDEDYDYYDSEEYDGEEEDDETKDDHPSFTRQFDSRPDSSSRVSLVGNEDEEDVQSQSSPYDQDEDDEGDIGYAELDQEMRHSPSRRDPGV